MDKDVLKHQNYSRLVSWIKHLEQLHFSLSQQKYV